ncbi:hypothetical protein [Marinoscillum furvescens]|uniref:hypothetical protein n=1 Tax=Marinoscillum furvescens TaxID=1026 RepID=UPI001C887643
MYEINLLTFLAEQSGGLALDGTRKIMKLEPLELHQRSPIFIGSTQYGGKSCVLSER